ncbi:toll/interleukin-1 receptor domain-containing protein [Ruminococcus sp.]|uniref:toll/interleukin-1 receptor domain-containing protein n=1 Tax=Ruminococcus sp. TaxID=41978 RepID=UPI0025EE34AF|nr:toll/interleukin-1 receptor domain-containing protein [Ruminococcus sp.]
MATFKCKMCGGALEITEKMTVCECEYCGTKQTLPKVSDEQKINMFNRANHFRQQCEFDKAAEIYEKMAVESENDAELFWSLVLCRYGIEYVDDPVTKNKIPTCHRTQYKSILEDPDYLTALDHADTIQRKVYEQEATNIFNIQKGILEISNKEKPFDVFICYKETDENGRRTPDSVLAQDLYYGLIQEGFKVFFSRITLESKLGTEYEPYIFAALNSAKVMVVVGTKPEYFNAVWVRNEWSRYLQLMQKDKSRIIIPAYKDMDPYELPDSLSLFQSQDMSKIGFLQDLIRGIKKVTNKDDAQNDDKVVRNQPTASTINTSVQHSPFNAEKKKPMLVYTLIGLIVFLCLGIGLLGGALFTKSNNHNNDVASPVVADSVSTSITTNKNIETTSSIITTQTTEISIIITSQMRTTIKEISTDIVVNTVATSNNNVTSNNTYGSSTPYTIWLYNGAPIYSEPGQPISGTIEQDTIYTIVEEKNVNKTKYGKLKSGVGWVMLDDVSIVALTQPIKGEINSRGATYVYGYTTNYVCNGGPKIEERMDLCNEWHITAMNVCYSKGITWYEVWDSDDGDYYGWVDEYFITFY